MPPAGLAPQLQPGAPGATPPGPAMGPDPTRSGGPINADEGIIWQNGRTTEEMRARWAAGAGAVAHCCPDCTAPLVWDRNFGGELVCMGCARSTLPLAWRRKVVQLWLTGMQASDIAKALRSTKNAVMGYRTRAMLPGRGSPLRGVADSQNARRRARAIRNRDQIKLKKPPAAPKPPPATRRAKVQREALPRTTALPGGAVAAENVRRPKGMPRHASRPGFTTCQYIVGRATFCDDPVAMLSPYCPAHTALCFVGQAA